MSRRALILLLAGLSGTFTGAKSAAPTESELSLERFLERTVTVEGKSYAYRVYLPPEYDPAKKWPVVLFLHGAGERGHDNLLQVKVGLAPALRKFPERYPAIVVFPQCPSGKFWAGPVQRMAVAALDAVMNEFSTDSDRVHLTGLSMGGNGSWILGSNQPERFVTISPVCGFVVPFGPLRFRYETELDRLGIDPKRPYAHVAERLKNHPVWIAHGTDDGAVPVEESRRMTAALERTGADVRYVEMPGVGHNSWDATYQDPEFAEWMFSHP